MQRKMRNVHPGEILKMELIEGRKLSVSKIAEQLESTVLDISNILNGNANITPCIAIKLETVFGGKAEHFMRLQTNYNLEETKNEDKIAEGYTPNGQVFSVSEYKQNMQNRINDVKDGNAETSTSEELLNHILKR